jgi:hypothetical protein
MSAALFIDAPSSLGRSNSTAVMIVAVISGQMEQSLQRVGLRSPATYQP